ncbi:MAG: glutaredoxin family protein [Methylophilaceae bacterium]
MNLQLYGTSACHLCEQASELLKSLCNEYDLNVIEVEISDDDELLEQYGTSIPVLFRQDNCQALYWPFSSNEVLDFIIKA